MGTNKRFNWVNETDFIQSLLNRIISHRDYYECYDNEVNKIGTIDDIALLEARQPIKLNKFIQIIKITTQEQDTKTCSKAAIVGSAIIRSSGNASETLVYSNTKMYKGSLNIERSRTKFYTAYTWSNDSALFRDSGGPFVCYHGRTPVLYGITLDIHNVTENNTNVVLTTYESLEYHKEFIKKYVPNVLIVDDKKSRHLETNQTTKSVANSVRESFYQIFCLFLFSFKCK